MFTHTASTQPKSWNHSSRTSTSTSTTNNPEKNFTSLYFAFSSNLSPQTMKGRHPDSLFCGLAILQNYMFTINTAGYANIETSAGDYVYGSLYFITARDEADLDTDGSVPEICSKVHLEVERVEGGQKVEALVYVDRESGERGVMDGLYVVWIRKAIRDGKKIGLPEEYAEKYIRPWLPEGEGDRDEDEEREMEPVRFVFSRDQFN